MIDALLVPQSLFFDFLGLARIAFRKLRFTASWRIALTIFVNSFFRVRRLRLFGSESSFLSISISSRSSSGHMERNLSHASFCSSITGGIITLTKQEQDIEAASRGRPVIRTIFMSQITPAMVRAGEERLAELLQAETGLAYAAEEVFLAMVAAATPHRSGSADKDAKRSYP